MANEQLDIDNILLDEEVVAPAAPKTKRRGAKTAAAPDLTNPLDTVTDVSPVKLSDLTPEELSEITVLRGKILDYKATFAEDLKDIKCNGVAECCDIDKLEDTLNQIRVKLSTAGGGNQWAGLYYGAVGGIESATMQFCPNTIMLEGLTNTLSANPQVNRCLQEMRIEHGNYLGAMTPELRLLQATCFAAWFTHKANAKKAAEVTVEKNESPGSISAAAKSVPAKSESDFFKFDNSNSTETLASKYGDI
jgi:hypothetical protein